MYTITLPFLTRSRKSSKVFSVPSLESWKVCPFLTLPRSSCKASRLSCASPTVYFPIIPREPRIHKDTTTKRVTITAILESMLLLRYTCIKYGVTVTDELEWVLSSLVFCVVNRLYRSWTELCLNPLKSKRIKNPWFEANMRIKIRGNSTYKLIKYLHDNWGVRFCSFVF